MHPCAYRLPHDVRDRLAAALKPLRNRDACMALATFIARFWTAPKRLGLPFMLDRRALAPVEALGLTEARVRGAVQKRAMKVASAIQASRLRNGFNAAASLSRTLCGRR